MIPHWESFKKNMLPMLNLVSPTKDDPVAIYEESLDQYNYPDIFTFSKLPFANYCSYYHAMLRVAGMPEAQAHSQFRVLVEEAYAVMTFEQTGCRIIKPAPALVTELLHTDTHFKLTEIRPPWPMVYIELPPGVGMTMRDFYAPDAIRDIKGVYINWVESCPEVRELSKQENLDKASGKDAELLRELYGAGGRYGDWLARFLVHIVDSKNQKIHEQTVRYFNMRWLNSDTDEVMEAYKRLADFWKKSDEAKAYPKEWQEFESEGMAMQEKIFTLTANLFAYMALPQAQRDVIWKPDEDRERLRNHGTSWNSKRRRNLKKRLREEMRTETWEVGQTIVIQRRQASETDKESGEGSHRSVRTHWRRGHIRMVWLGAHDSPDRHQEPRYIHPILVMGIGPAPETTTMVVR